MTGRMTRQIVVRVPEEMYQALAESADEHGRTVAQEVRFIIRGCSWLDILPPLRVSPPVREADQS